MNWTVSAGDVKRVRYRKISAAMFVALLAAGCAKPAATINLSPPAMAAFQATRVVKALDVARDFAVDANAQKPPILTTETTRKIVTWHRAMVVVAGATPAGWVQTIKTGLRELPDTLPANERALLRPYLDLASALLESLL